MIKSNYRSLSKKYHVDAARGEAVLPGSCEDLDEVELAWDDLKTAYEVSDDERFAKRQTNAPR